MRPLGDGDAGITFLGNIRCVIAGPSNYGKTWLLKNLIIKGIFFDKLYIIGPIGDQFEDIESISGKTDIEIIKDVKDLPSPDQLSKELKKHDI